MFFLLIVSYFFFNLFVGVMFSCFHDAYTKEKSKGLKENKHAERWWDYLVQVETSTPDWADYLVPKDPFLLKIYDITTNSIFDNFIMIIILLNLVTMAINFESLPTSIIPYNTALQNINLVFTSIFIVECVAKIVGLGPVRYFQNAWNKFDSFVVFASIIDLIVTNSTDANSDFLKSFQIIRVLRVLRVTR